MSLGGLAIVRRVPTTVQDGPRLIRPREPRDLPHLATLLAEQQARSLYPLRWPLPMPIDQFLQRADEERAWVADDGSGVPVGHVAVHSLVDDEPGRALVDALGHRRLALVAVLFTGSAERGRGTGSSLLASAEQWIRGTGRVPVLDVVADHQDVIGFYERHGWRSVGQFASTWPDAEMMLMAALEDEQATADPTGDR